MAITSSSSSASVPTSGFSLEQKSSSNPDGSWNIWYVKTTNSGSRRLWAKWRNFTGSAGVGWRDTDPWLRPVRSLFDERAEIHYGGIAATVTTVGQGGSRYTTSYQEYDRGFMDYTLISNSSNFYTAQQKFLEKARDLAVSAPVMAAEFRKTTHHLLDTANRVYTALRALRRGNFSQVSAMLHSKRHKRERVLRKRYKKSLAEYKRTNSLESWAKDFSGLWLEYQYAWRPLISDVQKSAELLASHHLNEDKLKPKRVVAHVPKLFEVTTLNSGYYKQVAICKSIYRAGGFVTYQLPVSNLQYRLGLTDPLSTAWELIPFSFVADWFVNIGDILAASTAVRSCTFTACWQSALHDQTTVTSLIKTEDPGYPFYTKYEWLQVPRSRIRRFTRDIMSPGIPPVRLKPDPFGLNHSITSLALVCQKIKLSHL